MGAATPIRPYVGSRPMQPVPTPIRTTVTSSIRRLPYLSPMWPNSAAPTGRATNPTANVANDANVPASGSSSGKNCRENTSAAAEP